MDLNFQDVMTSRLKNGRQCTKSGNHAVGLQENSSKNLVQNKTLLRMYHLRTKNIGGGFYALHLCCSKYSFVRLLAKCLLSSICVLIQLN